MELGLTFWNRAETGLLSPVYGIQIQETFAHLLTKPYHDGAAMKYHSNQSIVCCPCLKKWRRADMKATTTVAKIREYLELTICTSWSCKPFG